MLDLNEISTLVKKDFKLGTLKDSLTKESLKSHLSGVIAHLLQSDFQSLLNIMYRLDISEDKLKEALNTKIPSISIAELVISRELEKIKTRALYRSKKSG